MNRKKISVAMCSYNGERFIGEQLKSLVLQTRLPDELVICDDKSTDGTENIIKKFIENAPFPVRYSINDTNIGVVRNFEKAITLCTGDIIFLSDQDDVWVNEKLEKVEKVFEADPGADHVFSDALLTDPSGKDLPYTMWQHIRLTAKRLGLFDAGQQAKTLLGIDFVVLGCTMAFRSEMLRIFLPFPGGLRDGLHDQWIAMMLSFTGHRAVAIREPLVKYRQHLLQQSGSVATGIDRVKKIRSQRMDMLDQIEYFYQAGLRRLGPHNVEPESDRLLLESKLEHVKTRRRIRKMSRWIRPPFVFLELIKGGYHRFSLGLKSVMRDIFL